MCILDYYHLFVFHLFFTNRLWDEASMTLSSDLGHTLVTVLSGSLTHVHIPAAKALGMVMEHNSSTSHEVVQTLLQEYNNLYKVRKNCLYQY